MKELLLFVCQKLGLESGAVQAHEEERDGVRVVTVSVPEGSLDRIAGREQRLAKAIRVLLSTAAAAAETRVQVEIKEA